MSQAMGQPTIVVMCLVLAGCGAPAGPSAKPTSGYSVEVSEGSDRRALAQERAAQICAQETRNPNVMYVLEDAGVVKMHFTCEGVRDAAEVPLPRYRTLEKGIYGLSDK